MMFLEIKNVCKQYSGHVALNNVSLDVSEGSIYGLLGPNGAGKTSLIRIINRITHADSGEVLMNGKPMTDADVAKIGYLPEERGLYKKMKVGDQIVYLGRLHGMTKADAKAKMKEWLKRFELSEWEHKNLEALSKGMAQKVQFIATVIHRPPLLIFDEPFSGFDPVNADILKQEILRLRDEGSVVLFSTHNMSSVEEVCEEISLINHAEIVLQGKVKDIQNKYKKGIFEVNLTDGTTFEYKVPEGMSNHDAIAQLNESYDLFGFHEILPTMHEIFVQTVKE
ncbi:MAG: ABC transporter ATP-binding protein [Bacteroidales bacterium]|nr:ABC transporter ATP-binding protein [Bacteroidales bacterium]